jgi:HSP20 family protein
MNLKLKTFSIIEMGLRVANAEGPPVDVYETEDSLIVEIDLPGIETEKILIKVFNDLLILEGLRQEMIKEDVRFICMERSRDAFRKIIRLPVEIESDRGTAIYNNGVITLRFPKIKARVVKIKISKGTTFQNKLR